MTDEVFEDEIKPFLFDGIVGGDENPAFVLLTGQTGAGRSRAVGRLLNDSPGSVVLSAASMRPFLREGQDVEVVRDWMRDALTYARDNRVSVILEDAFQSAQDARAALDLFNAAGFQTRIIAVAVSRPESLLAAVARSTRQTRTVNRSRRAIRDDVDLGIRTQRELLSLPLTSTEVTIVRRDGVFVESTADPAGAWQDACAEPMPTRVAAEWISELRRITDAAIEQSNGSPNTIVDPLVDLHRAAISEVVPVLSLPANSTARIQLDARLKRALVALETLAAELNRPVGVQGHKPEADHGPGLDRP